MLMLMLLLMLMLMLMLLLLHGLGTSTLFAAFGNGRKTKNLSSKFGFLNRKSQIHNIGQIEDVTSDM